MALTTKVSWIATACLLGGVAAATTAAQIAARPVSASYVNCGTHTVLGGERAFFYLSLDDAANQPSARVRLQFLDKTGKALASDDVTLAAGRTAFIQLDGPAVVRAHADIFESTTDLTARRTAVGSVEVFDQLTTEPRFLCSADDVGSPGGRQ
jgi:hypothetical protein